MHPALLVYSYISAHGRFMKSDNLEEKSSLPINNFSSTLGLFVYVYIQITICILLKLLFVFHSYPFYWAFVSWSQVILN